MRVSLSGEKTIKSGDRRYGPDIARLLIAFLLIMLIVFDAETPVTVCLSPPAGNKRFLDLPDFIIIENTVTGKIAKSLPDTMVYGEDHTALASISASLSDSVLLYEVDRLSIDRDDIDTIRVSSKMKLSLIDPSGENFFVRDINNAEQIVDKSSNTIWRWNVRPLKSGTHKLLMIASITVSSERSVDRKDFKVMDKEVSITTPVLGLVTKFCGSNWEFILSAIVIPLIVYWFTVGRKKIAQRDGSENLTAGRKRRLRDARLWRSLKWR